MKISYVEHAAGISIIAMLVVALVAVIGCDESMDMAKTAVGDPDETPEPVMTGEVKQPKPVEEEVDPEEEPEEEVPGEEPVEDTEPDEDPEPPQEPQRPVELIEISYYADQDLTIPLTEPPYFGVFIYEAGLAIYTKVVYSGPVQVTVGEPRMAKPDIFYEFSGLSEDRLPYSKLYRIRPRETPLNHLESGEASCSKTLTTPSSASTS